MKTIALQVGIGWQGEDKEGAYPVFDLIPFGISSIKFPARRLLYVYLLPVVLMLAWNFPPKQQEVK